MSKRRRERLGEQQTLDLFEEAMHLLRMASAATLGWYALGVVPFILTLLYFWTDMSWSADARQDCAINASGVAFAFVWMKFCQAQFTQRLRSQLHLDPYRPDWRRSARIFLQQAVIQPSKLFLLPIALILTIPFGWLYAFYESVAAFGEAKNLRSLWSKSWKQAALWPRQNHLTLAIFSLLKLVMSVNVLLILVAVPYLARTFTGSENLFTRSGIHIMNSTSLAVVWLVAHFLCDPLLKAVYVLRCFYGESLHSGEDLQVELRRLRQKMVPAFSVLLIFVVSWSSLAAASSRSPVPARPTAPAVNAFELDRSISETIARPEYRWRMPRETADPKPDSEKDTLLVRWLRRLYRTLVKWWRAFLNWLDKIWPKQGPTMNGGSDNVGLWSRNILQIALVILCGSLLVLVGIKARQYYRGSRRRPDAPVAVKQVDLAREDVTADQMPEDDWLQMARDLIGKGDWRLALRALFLAGLAHLSNREIIALARYKSNRDYQGELRRRAPAQKELQQAFEWNLREVERAWYGQHDVSAEILAAFQSNLEKIRAT